MVDTLVVVSPDGKIQSVNNAMCKIFGYQEEELLGQPRGTHLTVSPKSGPNEIGLFS